MEGQILVCVGDIRPTSLKNKNVAVGNIFQSSRRMMLIHEISIYFKISTDKWVEQNLWLAVTKIHLNLHLEPSLIQYSI